MATSRDDRSARVTEKKLKDVQYVYNAQTQQKGINKMASPITFKKNNIFVILIVVMKKILIGIIVEIIVEN